MAEDRGLVIEGKAVSDVSDAVSDGPPVRRGEDPWTIRSMPAHERGLAVAAARRAGMSVAEWLAGAIRERVRHERGEVIGEMLAPDQVRGLTVSDVGRAVEIAARIIELRKAEALPARFAGRAAGMLRKLLT